jgi:hypothetical protein
VRRPASGSRWPLPVAGSSLRTAISRTSARSVCSSGLLQPWAPPWPRDLDGRWRATGAPPILLAVSAAGVYFTVPETDEAAILLGGAVVVALLGLGAVANLGSAGAFAAVGLLVWTAATGGAARPSSIVGSLGCLGLFLVEPLARLFAHVRSGLEGGPRSWRVISAVGAQVSLVAIASRWAGLPPVAETAALVVMAEIGVALAILVGTERARSTRASSASEHGDSS